MIKLYQYLTRITWLPMFGAVIGFTIEFAMARFLVN